MANNKVKYPTAIFGPGPVYHAWFNKPDTKFANDGESGDYKGKLALEDTEENRAKCEKLFKDAVAASKQAGLKMKKNAKSPFVMPEDVDEDDFIPDPDTGRSKLPEELQGTIYFETKSKFRPGLIDAAKNELPDDVFPMSGDICKIKVEARGYEGFGSGVTLKLRTVQLIEKNTNFSGGGVDAEGFDEEDGYVADSSDDEDDEDGDKF